METVLEHRECSHREKGTENISIARLKACQLLFYMLSGSGIVRDHTSLRQRQTSCGFP